MTVFENMGSRSSSGSSTRRTTDDKVRRAAKILGIESLLERKPKALSGLRPGDTTPIFFDLDRAHFFELGELGRSLTRPPVPSA